MIGASSNAVLLTGFPQLEAQLLLTELLRREPTVRLFAVIKAEHAAHAQLLVARMPHALRRQLVLLDGDPSAIDMGLSGKEFAELGSQIDRVFHLATDPDPALSAEAAAYANVQSTCEALELARSCTQLRCMLVRSSTAVSGTRRGRVFEDDLMAGQRFRSAAEESLAHAERIARRAMSKLPVCVVRPASVIADSHTGELDRPEGLSSLVLMMIGAPAELSLPLPAPPSASLNVVPIDFFAKACCQIASDPRAPGKTFHLVDPTPATLGTAFERIAQLLGKRPARGHLPGYLANMLLRIPGIDRLVGSPRYLVEWLSTPVCYDSRNTDQILAGTDIQCPTLDSYLPKIVDALRQRSAPQSGHRRDDEPER